MEISYTPDALKDREFWKKSGNKAIIKKSLSSLKPLKKTQLKAQENLNN